MSAYEPNGPSGWHSFRFLLFLLSHPPPPPPQWDASPSQGYMYLTLLNLAVLDYPPEWKQAMRGKCLAQEHNTMLPARAQGQTAQNRKEIKSNNRLFTQTAYKI